MGTKKAFRAIWLVTSKEIQKIIGAKNFLTIGHVIWRNWLPLQQKMFWKKVFHFYTNRKGIKNALKIIVIPYAKSQYFKSHKHFCILKKPGVNYRYNRNTFLLKHVFTSFRAVCMTDLSCNYVNVLLKYPNCWFKNIIFNPSFFQQFHVFLVRNANFLTVFWPMRRCFIFI